ncbi:MAG: hypothetical protein HYX38_01995 [Rhodospirillales bacterium]|nr:hypothetical protein [Rhodospirillales bacterium]
MRQLGLAPDVLLTVDFLTVSVVPLALVGFAALLWWPEVKRRVALYFGPEYLPLPEAAKVLYQQGMDESFGMIARATGSSDDGILDFCGKTIAEKVPVYGVRRLGILELIPERAVRDGFIRRGASVLCLRGSSDDPKYTQLAIKSADFRRRFRRFKGTTKEWTDTVPA